MKNIEGYDIDFMSVGHASNYRPGYFCALILFIQSAGHKLMKEFWS